MVFLGGAGVFWLKSRIPKAKILGILEFLSLNLEFLRKNLEFLVFLVFVFFGCGGFSVNTVEREMAESAGLVKDTGFVRDFKPELSKDIGEFYAKYKGLDNPEISA